MDISCLVYLGCFPMVLQISISNLRRNIVNLLKIIYGGHLPCFRLGRAGNFATSRRECLCDQYRLWPSYAFVARVTKIARLRKYSRYSAILMNPDTLKAPGTTAWGFRGGC